jgi:hypothetical protein
MICGDVEIAHGSAGDVQVVGLAAVTLDKNEIVLIFPKGFEQCCVMAFAIR